jgi:hypothetical protein
LKAIERSVKAGRKQFKKTASWHYFFATFSNPYRREAKMPKIFARHRAGFVIEFDNVDRERIDETVTWLLHAWLPAGCYRR